MLEIISPGDETRAKLPFYAAYDVDEVVIVDLEQRTVEWLELTAGEYQPARKSHLLDLDIEDLIKAISWPSGG